ncbi:MAG: hypothetical protein ACPGVO_01475 [Spirulinaceae cyanobacterium]
MTPLPSDAHEGERHDFEETTTEETEVEAATEDEANAEPESMMSDEEMPHDTVRESTPDETSQPPTNDLQSTPQPAAKTRRTFPKGLGETLFGLLFAVPLGLYAYKYRR